MVIRKDISCGENLVERFGCWLARMSLILKVRAGLLTTNSCTRVGLERAFTIALRFVTPTKQKPGYPSLLWLANHRLN